MKVLQINSVCGQGSTGRICTGIADSLKNSGDIPYIAYSLGYSTYPNSIKICHNPIDYPIHNILSKISDSEGLHSIAPTRFLINQICSIQPDIIHLHTLHGHYINYKLLLEYINKIDVPVVLTLHDCWNFTGHCAHFDMYDCNKWKTGCKECKYLSAYPQSYFLDKSSRNFNLKKKLFTQLGDRLTIVPVSYWMENLVRQSFFFQQKIKTIHNGIDLKQFYPITNSKIKEEYRISGKYIVLGVAMPWSKYKGFPDFFTLRKILSEDYSIVLIGVSQEQISQLPEGIIGISRIDDIKKLVEFYSIANVLVNTTYCDNYPTVNLESIACGTPVITYNTGGSPEALSEDTGLIVEQGNVNKLGESIQYLCNHLDKFSEYNCLKRAHNYFDKDICFKEYIDLYKTITK